MTKEEAISFLQQHQPMPDDKYLSSHPEIIDKYDEVREYFLNNPDEDCIPLILNSFGEGDGLGVYQLVPDVIAQLSKEKVLPFLLEGFKSKNVSIRYWCVEIAGFFPDDSLIEPLVNLLNDSDEDIRVSSISSLSFIENDRIKGIIEKFIENETDSYVKDFAVEKLREL